jgi:phosphate transport system substrate-binding protein
MNYGSKRFSTRTKLIGGAIALVLAGSSFAAVTTTQVSGGGTLMSLGFAGPNAASNLLLSGTSGSSSISSNSLYGQYMAQSGFPTVSYCETGSGAGKDVLAGGTIGAFTYNVQNNCVKTGTPLTVTGFGAATVGRTDLTQPNLADADAPIAASDLTNYHAGHGTSDWPTQFPIGAGAIAIAVNLKDNMGTQITSSEMNFTPAQICKIFTGTVTLWNDSTLASAFHLPAGRSIPNNTINVVYRSDGSGTTFGFSNFMAANCPATGSSPVVPHVIEASQNFGGMAATGVAGPVLVNYSTATPAFSTWQPESGNAAVANEVASDASSVGYVEYANANAVTTLQVADVSSFSPSANFGTALPITSGDVVYNEVISATNNSDGTPALTKISSPPTTSCIALIPPADYANPSAKTTIIPANTYPIMAVSYFLGNAQGSLSPSDLTGSQELADAPYNSTITGSVTTFGSTTGLAFLNLGTTPAFAITAPGACLH